MAGAAHETQLVTLGLGREVFAVPVEYVREILDYREPFAIPEGPAWFLGLTDVRGQAVPTLDLRVRLGLPPVPPDLGTRILVLDVPMGERTLSLGLVADRVIEVDLGRERRQIEPAARDRRALALGLHPRRRAAGDGLRGRVRPRPPARRAPRSPPWPARRGRPHERPRPPRSRAHARRRAGRPFRSLGERLTPANFKRLAEFVQAYSGIKMPPAKKTMLEGRLRKRVRACGLRDVNDYCRFLFEEDGVETELVHLIDAVTTNKTDFFREPAHFDFLPARSCRSSPTRAGAAIRAWSAAASIGAEAYTLAMVLEDFCAGRGGMDYAILGTDLCTQVLAQAVRGVYPASMSSRCPRRCASAM